MLYGRMCPGAGRSTSCARHALLLAVVPEPMVTVATEEARFDRHPLLFPPPKRQKGNATAPVVPPPWDGLTWSVGTPRRVVGKYPTPSPLTYSPSCTQQDLPLLSRRCLHGWSKGRRRHRQRGHGRSRRRAASQIAGAGGGFLR